MFDEVEAAVGWQGRLLHRQILWPLLLTQGVGIWKKSGEK
jgi:hypothetical protein